MTAGDLSSIYYMSSFHPVSADDHSKCNVWKCSRSQGCNTMQHRPDCPLPDTAALSPDERLLVEISLHGNIPLVRFTNREKIEDDSWATIAAPLCRHISCLVRWIGTHRRQWTPKMPTDPLEGYFEEISANEESTFLDRLAVHSKGHQGAQPSAPEHGGGIHPCLYYASLGF